MKWTSEERETLLRYDFIDKIWIIYTNIPRHWRRFKNLGFELVSEVLEGDKFIDAEFKCNERIISFRNVEKAMQSNRGFKRKDEHIYREGRQV